MKAIKIVSAFKNGSSRIISIYRDYCFEGVDETTIVSEVDMIILRPARPSWTSLANESSADNDFLLERDDVISDEKGESSGRYNY